jgi:pyruvate dehydrogenase E2 component (dihydrolipoamide acetyltransferase)
MDTRQSNPYKETLLKGMRKTIAEHMAKSSRENAVIMISRHVDVTDLLEMRKNKREDYTLEKKAFPSINDLVIKSVALALKEHTSLNATFQDERIRTYEECHINLAVAVENGLITPVIRNVGQLTIDEIAEKTGEAIDKVKNGMFGMDDITGGTFTITNVGMVKVEVATAIINYPQVAILAVGAILPQLEMHNGDIIQRQKMVLSLTVDHRIIDGHPAALFLNEICDKLESPETIWEG